MAGTVTVAGHEQAGLEAYLGRPLGERPRGGVVVLHHLPWYDDATKQIVRNFAAHGYAAICLNLYSREGAGVSPDDQAAAIQKALAAARSSEPAEDLCGQEPGRHMP